MQSNKPGFSITIPSQTQLLRMVVELTKHITVLYHFPPVMAEKISLAVDEAVTNVIKHSYQNSEDRELTIEYFPLPEGLKIRIVYTGTPPKFSANEIDLPQMIKTKRKGGLGVELMRRIMDSVDYQTVNGINTCELVKWLKAT